MKTSLLKTFLISIAAAGSAFLCAADPILDFRDFQETDGSYRDQTGNAVLKPGKGTSIGEGPFGGKAFCFDGTAKGLARLEYDKIRQKFDGFEFTVSFWFRFDELLPIAPKTKGNDTGLGLTLGTDKYSFSLGAIGPGGVSVTGQMEPQRWHHLVFLYSVQKQVTKMYVNGLPVLSSEGSGKRYPLRFLPQVIGNMKGSIADLVIWDTLLPTPDEFLSVHLSEKFYKDTTAQIQVCRKQAESAAGMCNALQTELDNAFRTGKMTVAEFDSFFKRLQVTEHLAHAASALSETSFRNAPLAIMKVKAISPIIRLPNTYPPDPEYTEIFRARTAKGAYESVSFIVHPYKDIEKLEFELGDLKDKSGHVIPSDQQELKLVKCWYQPGWNTYFNGHGEYVPGLLLNDENLVHVDEQLKINYLRLNYPTGVQYANICIPGSVLKHPPFDFAFEPAYDADTLQPVKLVWGRGTQFWLTLHAPEGCEAGTYKGPLVLKADGQIAGTIQLELEVLPFHLPIPRTQYDHTKEYFTELAGSAQLALQIQFFKDEEKAFERLKLHIDNQKKHGIRGQSPGYRASAPGMSSGNTGAEYFERDLRERMKAGIHNQCVVLGSADAGTMFIAAKNENLSIMEYATKERVDESFEQFKVQVDEGLAALQAIHGNTDAGFFYGADEASSPDQMRFMSMYRDYIFRHGGHVVDAGWHNNYRMMPSHMELHHQAAEVSRVLADRWHAINGKILCYCGPFIGPDNPDLMRRSHGLKMFRNNFDGWSELAYDGGSNYHTWNHLFGHDTTYRPFRFIVSTCKGPIINTLAFEGMREGMDDVRYATLLYQLADECLDSGDAAKITAARKAIVWFRDLEFPSPQDLDSVRDGMVYHILNLMKHSGKEKL